MKGDKMLLKDIFGDRRADVINNDKECIVFLDWAANQSYEPEHIGTLIAVAESPHQPQQRLQIESARRELRQLIDNYLNSKS